MERFATSGRHSNRLREYYQDMDIVKLCLHVHYSRVQVQVQGHYVCLSQHITAVRAFRRFHHLQFYSSKTLQNKAMAHCRLHPRHPSHCGLLQCVRQPSSRTRVHTTRPIRRNRALSCARRRNDITHCNGIDMPSYGPLCANMTSSVKPEVHNLSQRRQRRTEPRSWVHVTCAENW